MKDTNNHRETCGQSCRKFSFTCSILCMLAFIFSTSPAQALDRGIENLRETGKAFASVAKKSLSGRGIHSG